MALMFAIDRIEERVVRRAVDGPLDVEPVVAATVVALRIGSGSREAAPRVAFGCFVIAMVALQSLLTGAAYCTRKGRR